MFLSDYLGLKTELDDMGVFDPILDSDSYFFINIQRLKQTTIPEFTDSHNTIHSFFRRLIKLLDKAKIKDARDICYRRALTLFDFPEVNGICLGYASGIQGSGFGRLLSSQIIDTAYEIVKLGIDDPEMFELLPLFQENVGPDRISDMIAGLILDDIKTYTLNVFSALGINQFNYREKSFENGFLLNPYKQMEPLLLVPIDILQNLPVALSWEDIDSVVYQNKAIRCELNQVVIDEWKKYSTTERKAILRESIAFKPDAMRRVIESYRKETLCEFNPRLNFDYQYAKLDQESYITKASFIRTESLTSFDISCQVLNLFRNWVENNMGWDVISSFTDRKKEKLIQRVIHLCFIACSRFHNIDVSFEANEGRGPLDFKISKGRDKTVSEVKLSSNSQYLHGLKVQIREYAIAEETNQMVYVLVDLGHPRRVKQVQRFNDKQRDEGVIVPKLIIIDSRPKESASKYFP